MFCLHDHANAKRLQAFHQRVGNLNRELLLDLKAPRENIDNARDLRKADHFSVRNISDVRPADEWKQMMFAHRVELDVFDENDLARFRAEDRAVNNLFQVLAVTIREELERLGRACRSSEQTFALRILADRFEQIAKRLLHARELRCATLGQTAYPALRRLQFRFAVA